MAHICAPRFRPLQMLRRSYTLHSGATGNRHSDARTHARTHCTAPHTKRQQPPDHMRTDADRTALQNALLCDAPPVTTNHQHHHASLTEPCVFVCVCECAAVRLRTKCVHCAFASSLCDCYRHQHSSEPLRIYALWAVAVLRAKCECLFHPSYTHSLKHARTHSHTHVREPHSPADRCGISVPAESFINTEPGAVWPLRACQHQPHQRDTAHERSVVLARIRGAHARTHAYPPA